MNVYIVLAIAIYIISVIVVRFLLPFAYSLNQFKEEINIGAGSSFVCFCPCLNSIVGGYLILFFLVVVIVYGADWFLDWFWQRNK